MARSEKTRSTVQAHKMEEMEGDGVGVGWGAGFSLGTKPKMPVLQHIQECSKPQGAQ